MTRRHLILTSRSLAPAALAADAWKKKYADWKRDDALAILSRSPWAQTAKIEFKIDGQEIDGPRSGGIIGPPEGPPGGNGSVGPPGGAPARPGGGIVQKGPGTLPDFKVLARWESAKPVRLAMGIEGEPANSNLYTVSLIGFPILRADLAASLAPMKATTRLERGGGKDWLRATHVINRETGGVTAIVFSFDGTDQPITPDDREVLFVTRLGLMHLRVKFTLKDMTFERKLAV